VKEIRGKVAVVTGSGSGIGRATALALAQAGGRLIVSDLNAERCHSVTAEIKAHGGEAFAQPCDVTSDEDMAGLQDAALSEFGAVDIVMNNVGVLALGKPENIPLEAWQRILDVNVLSIARSIRVFLPGLLAQGSGHVVNTASTAGLYAYSFERLPYSASKAAVIAMSEALALYTLPRGVGVTVLCPGPVATNIVEQVQVYGELGAMRSPALAVLDPAVVGAQVVSAIQNETFFLPTHQEVHNILVERSRDPEGFLRSQIEVLRAQDEAAGT
jgi:NAD(P)-dependent dehydrogenase (short-subunit alcohol dehydrogenase family)